VKISCLQPRSLGFQLALLTSLVITNTAMAAQTYTITNLGSLSTQYAGSVAYGLNATGDVVGYAFPSSGAFQGFLWKNGVMSNLGHLADPYYVGTPHSVATAVNDSDHAVGWSEHTYTANGIAYNRAVLWQNGVITDLGTLPNYLLSVANAINSSGQIVGRVGTSTSGGGDRAILWQSGALIDLGTLGGTASTAYAINDAGQIVGKSYTARDAATHAFVWQNGVMTDLGALGAGTVSIAAAINASGQIVGASTFAAPGDLQDRHAFFYSNGVMSDLGVPTPNAVESYANGINKDGTIIGASGGRAFVYSAGAWTDLNTVIPANTGWTLKSTQAINDVGQIVGTGTLGGVTFGYLLTPNSPGVDLAATLTASPNPATTGSQFTYTATVTNSGTLTATGATLTDVLPAGVNLVSASASQGSCSGTTTVLCALGTLNSSASANVQITVTPVVTGTLTNNLSVASNEVDVQPSNNTASTSVVVNMPVAMADLSLNMSATPNPVKRQATLTYNFVVANNGPNTATSVALNDTLPSNVSLISSTTSQGSCSGTTTVTCLLGNVASGAAVNMSIAVRTGRTTSTLSNTANVTSTAVDPNTVNNTASVSVNVVK